MKKPDYVYHANSDKIEDVESGTWLLFEKEPMLYGWEVRLDSIKSSYNEKEWKVYKILCSINWDHNFKDAPYYQGRNVIHIFMLVIEAINRQLPLPDELFKAVDARYTARFKKSIRNDAYVHNNIEQPEFIPAENNQAKNNEAHPNYAIELQVANEAWQDLCAGEKPMAKNKGVGTLFERWLENSKYDIAAPETIDRIKKIITPNNRKDRGGSKFTVTLKNNGSPIKNPATTPLKAIK